MKNFLKIMICLLSLSNINCNSTTNEDIKIDKNISYEIIDENISTAHSPNLVHDDTLYETDYYAPHYFSNLKNNYGYNVKGSCTYIAFDMLLSFYDTYWDDSFIPENYDFNVMLDENQFDLSLEAPGVYGEARSLVTGKTTNEYYILIEQYSNFYHHFKLLEIGKQIFQHYNFEDENNPAGLTYSELKELAEYYLYEVLDKTESQVEILTNYSENMSVKDFTISMIQQGIPVELRAGNPTRNTGHAMVAYDYDEKTDTIYVHPGWRNYSDDTHVTLQSTGYTNLWDAMAIVPRTSHSHSNNYKYINEYEVTDTHCVCLSVLPTEIEIVSEYALDVLPTFKWNSLINEKWFTSSGLYHRFDILNSSNYSMYTTTCDSNIITLTTTAWDAALNATGNVYKICIGIESTDDTYWDDYYYSQTFSEPTEFINKIQIKPNEWGFEGRYYFESEGIKTSTLTKGDLTITTRRLRCGYIEDSYINLSPRREGAGEAYFEMVFDKPVYSFMYSICLWSGSEYLDGIAEIDVLTSEGEWVPYVNLLEDIELTIRTIGLERYCHYISSGIYGIKFEATSTATGDRNKGRLCIDDLVLSVNPGLINNYYLSTNYAKTNS
ncbi:MAG: hypothetical protein IKC22_07485 [Bacilli bacterium]|nr:hypothetical protein [Bacilli bacterium]MBR2892191.1 hypothetical protein [Bacilli bacterium]